MPANDTNEESVKGIDFRQALSILSQRTSDTHTHEHGAHHACPCQAPPAAAEAVQRMGQVIHLNVGDAANKSITDKETSPFCTTGSGSLPANASQPKPHLIEAFRSLSTRQLLQAALSAQQDRVATYHDYNRGLEAVLATKNIAYYPTVCTDATAKFAIVGDTMRAALATLEQRTSRTGCKNPSLTAEIQQLIRSLQGHEQQKLQYTAALHLEQIRLHQIEDDDRVSKKLLEDSSLRLQQKLTACVGQINEVLEEMQCALVDAPHADDESKHEE